MTLYRIYYEEQGGFWPLKAPPNISLQKMRKASIYNKF